MNLCVLTNAAFAAVAGAEEDAAAPAGLADAEDADSTACARELIVVRCTQTLEVARMVHEGHAGMSAENWEL